MALFAMPHRVCTSGQKTAASAGSKGVPVSLPGLSQSCPPASLCWLKPPTSVVLALGHHCSQRGLCSLKVIHGPEHPQPTGFQVLGSNWDLPAGLSAASSPVPMLGVCSHQGQHSGSPPAPFPPQHPTAYLVPCLLHRKVGTCHKPIGRAVAPCRSRLLGREDVANVAGQQWSWSSHFPPW